MNNSSRTIVFRTIGAAVALNALAGIYALLGSGSMSETEEDILWTVVNLTLLSVVLLPPIATWDRVRIERLPIIPAASALCSIATALIILVYVWFDPDDGSAEVPGSLMVLGAGLAHISLLLTARPSAIRALAIGFSGLLCAEILVTIWITDDDPSWRLLGILTILALASSILLPIWNWASGSKSDGQEAEAAVRFCPYCGNELEGGQTSRCTNCGSGFQVRSMA